MNEPDLIRLIKQIVRRELTPINMATVVSTQDQMRASMQRFSSEGEVPNLRLILPYGVTARPKAGTDAVIAPIQGDPTHLNMIGQFDAARPSVADGETGFYGPDGQIMHLKSGGDIEFKTAVDSAKKRFVLQADGTVYIGEDKQISTTPDKKVFLGSPSAAEPAVLGNVLKSGLNDLESAISNLVTALSTFAAATSAAVVEPTLGPASASLTTALAPVTAALTAFVTQYLSTPSSNIVSQQVFVEREP